ncbi:reverse transcriptase domain-containing protein [Tanacetum coccineum]
MANVTSLLTSLCENFKNSASTLNSGTLPSQTVTNPRQQINAITTRSGKTLEEPSTPLVPKPVTSNPQQEPEQNPETSTEKVQNPNLENTAHVPSPGEEDSIFIEIPKPKVKKTVNVEIQDPKSPNPNSYQSKLPYPERMKVREHDKPKVQQMVPEKLKDSGKFLIPCALQELNRTSALANSGASINLLPHSIYKKLKLEALTPTRMTLELANRSITHPMGIAEDVVDLHEENFQEDVEIKNSNVSDKLVFLNTPLSDKDECFAPEDDNDEIDDFLAIEVSSNLEEGYFDSEGDIAFLDNLLSDDDSHNLDSKVTSDHEPEQNESSITFSPRSDPLHHEFAGEPLTLPARNDREFEEYLSLMTVLNEISTSQGNFHQNSVIESLPMSPILVEDSEPTQEEIDILLVPDNLIPPGVEDADSEDEVNESPNLDHQDDPSIPRPPPEPPDIEKCFEPKAGILIIKEFKGVSKSHDFMTSILPTLVSDLPFISSIVSFENEDTIFDPGIVTFLRASGIF